MRKSLNIMAFAAVAVAALWAWSSSDSGAKVRNSVSGTVPQIDTLDLTKKGTNLPAQQFDAI